MKIWQKVDFFFIQCEQLGDKIAIFPFDIYIYHAETERYRVDLYANSPYTEEKREFYQRLQGAGGKIAIKIAQQKTFLSHLKLTVEQVDSLQKIIEIQHTKESPSIGLEMPNSSSTSQQYIELRKQFRNALERNDFLPVILSIRGEILQFPKNHTLEVSNAIALSEKMLTHDSLINRIVALSFTLAKLNHITDHESLSSLIMAAFLHDIGVTQINRQFSRLHHNLIPLEQSAITQHPGHSTRLLRKGNYFLTNKVLNLIEEHHETNDGQGYPNQKLDTNFTAMTSILNLSSALILGSAGKLTGAPIALRTLIKSLQLNQKCGPLRLVFAPENLELLNRLFSANELEQAA